ncbi:hypothetical protein AB0P07_27485 [Streptomyces sp. NPDC085944]|uniref:hypothetical protein n=1 Tax=Streptomyces sp. NPDC085944 TaxID=3154962 RepID=UPI0034432D8D
MLDGKPGKQGGEVEHGHQADGREHRDGAVSATHRAVDSDQVGDGEDLEPGRQTAHRRQPRDGQDHERRPAARGRRRPADRRQDEAGQLAAPGRGRPGQPGPRTWWPDGAGTLP